MGSFVNQVIALGSHRASRHANRFSLDMSRAEIDAACIEDAVDVIAKGTKTFSVEIAGKATSEQERLYLEELSRDQALWPATLALSDGVSGALAAMAEGSLTNYRDTTQRNNLLGFQATLKPASPVGFHGLGLVLWNTVGTAGISAPAAAPGVNLGPVPDGGELTLFVHPLDWPGIAGTDDPGLDLVLESDVDNTFSAPVARAVVPTINAASFEAHILRVAGGVTDTWWRLRAVNVTGTDPNFHLLAAAAISS